MTSTTRVVQVQDAARHKLVSEFGVFHNGRLSLPAGVTTTATASTARSLKDVVDGWNNLPVRELESGWKFLLLHHDDVVGYIPDVFARAATWDASLFQRDAERKLIRLIPGDKSVEACNEALVTFCEQNKDCPGFKNGLEPWLRTKHKHDLDKGALPDYTPLLTCRPEMEGVKAPSPIRGILGILTSGVHMNTYTVKRDGNGNEVVDTIWVSYRKSTKKAYGNCYDQIVAGGMDPEDERDPWVTLDREASEEAGYECEGARGPVMRRARDSKPVGTIEGFQTIYYCTKRDAKAGKAEEGHIEPGVRFCFDLRLDAQQTPRPHETGMDFYQYPVDKIKQSLRDGLWKPNSGLVMLDFLLRRGLVDSQSDCEAIRKLSTQGAPLDMPEFPTSAWDTWDCMG